MGTSLQFGHCGREETESCLFGLFFFKTDRKRRGGGDEGGRQKKEKQGWGRTKEEEGWERQTPSVWLSTLS